MKDLPSLLEDDISKIPALHLLQKLGFSYLTPEEALSLRGGRKSVALLDSILEEQLKKINSITFRGKSYEFSESSFRAAIQALKEVSFDGLVRTNEKIYDLLTLGKSFEQTIVGDTRSFSLKYIDWQHPENNVYHVTEEFAVERTASWETRIPDIVLFVNGIPLVVIESKRPDILQHDPIEEAISQQIRNQKEDEIPKLFTYAQLLMGISKNDAKYATVGTPLKFWGIWEEKDPKVAELKSLINEPLKANQKDKLFGHRKRDVRDYFERQEREGDRLPTSQDAAIYNLCRPERLVELVFQFIVFDGGEKKIARYQQYFTVKEAMRRITSGAPISPDNKWGVVWHGQGSGKSITMVMLAKAIALCPKIQDPRIVLVTSRVDLDDQLYGTFKSCGTEPHQAATGAHLIELIQSKKASIITTLINKFTAGFKKRPFTDDANNIFILVDEAHRSQHGMMNVDMRRVYPNGWYLGFTGTPLNKQDKSTAIKFGTLIEPYPMDKAVRDGAVVPLLYECRLAVQEVNQAAIDKWFERVTQNLSDEQKSDLKKKFSSISTLNSAEQRIKLIAYDASDHFVRAWQGTGFKGQLVAQSQDEAVRFKKYFDECGLVKTDVLISPPDTRESHDDIYEGPTSAVQDFWKKMLQKYGSDERYNKQLINAFKNGEEPEIIIVVKKLIEGFDAPRNVVLYLCAALKDHTLLQAIARVNRLYEGKQFGYILDYAGVLGNLDRALTEYSSLENFSEEDLEGTLTSINKEVDTLPQKHADLWAVFSSVPNKRDEEAYEVLLGDEELRHRFYERLSSYSRCLEIALASVDFNVRTSPNLVKAYKADLKFFMNLRTAVQRRYAEKVDFKEYEVKVRKLVDTYVSSDEIEKITDLVNIFDKEKFQAEVERVTGTAAKADTIASRTKKTISEKWDEDPAFYKRFSELLEQSINAFRNKLISEAEYLAKVTTIMEQVRERTGDDTPSALRDNKVAKAFYGILFETLKLFQNHEFEAKGTAAEIALKIEKIISDNACRDWIWKPEVENRMKNGIDDCLFDLRKERGIPLTTQQMDEILEASIQVAKKQCAR